MKTLSAGEHKKGFLVRLQDKWKLKNTSQVILVLFVFACTGTTVMMIKSPIFELLGIPRPWPWWAYIIYLIAVLPVYNVILLFYGFIFGQFRFFWEFEKRMFKRFLNRK